MFREAWPSDRKLEELREEGVVPYSRFASTAAALFALILWFLTTDSEFMQLMEKLKQILASDAPRELMKNLSSLLEDFLKLTLVPALLAAGAAAAVGLGQTKFLILPSLMKFSTRRINPLRPPSIMAIVGRVAVSLITLAFLAAVSLVSAWLLFPAIFGMLALDASHAAAWPTEAARTWLPFLLACTGIAAGAAWLLERVHFMIRHRMTKEELEAENRE